MLAFNKPQSATTDPILIREFPDPNNPASLDPRDSTWIDKLRSAADIGQLLAHHIQSRFFKYFVSIIKILYPDTSRRED